MNLERVNSNYERMVKSQHNFAVENDWERLHGTIASTVRCVGTGSPLWSMGETLGRGLRVCHTPRRIQGGFLVNQDVLKFEVRVFLFGRKNLLGPIVIILLPVRLKSLPFSLVQLCIEYSCVHNSCYGHSFSSFIVYGLLQLVLSQISTLFSNFITYTRTTTVWCILSFSFSTIDTFKSLCISFHDLIILLWVLLTIFPLTYFTFI